MKVLNFNIALFVLLTSFILFQISCTTENKQENTSNKKLSKSDSTNSSGITFFRRIDNKTGAQIWKGTSFTIMEDGRVHASVDIKNYLSKKDRDIMLHFDWINPDGYSFYQRREDVAVDSSTIVNSSISLSPNFRKEGVYKLRVYLYRKLLLEDSFELLPKFQLENYTIDNKNLTLSTKINKAIKHHEKENIEIVSMKGKWVEASLAFENSPQYKNRELLFRYDWVGEDGKIFYRKRMDISPADSTIVLKSSLSISPEERQEGKYAIQLYLFDEILAQVDYRLLPPLDTKKVKSSITFCSNVDKKTTKRTGINSIFNLGTKAKVYACVDLSNCLVFGERELNFRLKWVDTDGKTMFSKRFNFAPNKSSKTLISAISISPKKREKGDYKLQVLLFNELIAEKSFTLRPTLNPKNLKSTITLYSKEDKNTGKKIGVGSSFNIKNKRKVNALIDIENPLVFGKKELKFRVEWIGINGKSFYAKNLTMTPNSSDKILKSAISIPPNKRKPGNYKIRLFLFGKLIKERAFILKNE